MSYRGPKVKISRKLGLPMTPKAAKVMEHKPYPPGQAGTKKGAFKGRASVYKTQLLEKQKLRYQYNISEKQLNNYFKTADRKAANTADVLIELLETRLDMLVFRAGFARTIYAARQYVSHGHIMLNGRKIDKASAAIRVGDKIEVKEKSRKLPCFQEAIASTPPAPGYLLVDKENMNATLQYVPKREEVAIICDVASVIEYYSK